MFRYIDRWQTSLRDLFDRKPDNDRLVALLEIRDRQLEAYLAGPGWEDYTPTDTNITVGNGTRVARKRVHADGTVDFHWRLLLGSSSSISGNASIGLPVTVTYPQTAVAMYYDDGTRWRPGVCNMESASGLLIHTDAAGSGIVNATSPFTWTNPDRIQVSGTIEPETS